MIEFETKKGKTVRLYPDGNGWRVMFTSGGELPEELSGIFTSQGIATKVIERYIDIGVAPSRRA